MSNKKNKLLRSSGLLLLAKTVQRSLSIISVLILARLLSPEDFAVVAISGLVLYFCEALSSTGSEPYIVRKYRVTRKDLSTAWTLDLLFKFLVLSILFITIPFIADFYADPRLKQVLYVASSILLINALKSPGLIILKRNLEYRKIFFIMISQKILSFTVVVSIAFFQKSYWALIIGDIVSAVTLMVGSYLIHYFRPRFSLACWKEQWLFSKWIFFRASIGYGKSQMDSILVSKFFAPAELGAFYMSKNLSTLPSTDIIGPVVEPLLATFSKNKDNFMEFNQQISKAFFLVGTIIIPIGIFMIFFPNYIINFFFGSGWEVAYGILPALSLNLMIIGVGLVLNQAFVALGAVKQLFIYEVLGVISLGIVLYISKDTQIGEFSWIRAWLSVGLFTFLAVYFRWAFGYSVERAFLLLVPVSVAAIISALLTMQFDATSVSSYSIVILFISVSIYFAAFIFLTFSYIYLLRNRSYEANLVFNSAKEFYRRFT